MSKFGRDILRATKKKLRDAELADEQGWTAKSKIHKSNKQYSRKNFKINIENND